MKVLVNGCSHIAGTELAATAKVAKTLTWPNLINEWTDITNLAMPAASNDSICRRTITELDKNHYDFVYVQWTHFDRIELQIPFYKEQGAKKEWFCINSNNASQKTDLNGNPDLIFDVARSIFLRQFNDTWFDNFNTAQIVMLQTYLKSRNIPYQFGFVLNKELEQIKQTALVDMNQVVDMSWLDFCNTYRFKQIIVHYEQNAHKEYARRINLLRN